MLEIEIEQIFFLSCFLQIVISSSARSHFVVDFKTTVYFGLDCTPPPDNTRQK